MARLQISSDAKELAAKLRSFIRFQGLLADDEKTIVQACVTVAAIAAADPNDKEFAVNLANRVLDVIGNSVAMRSLSKKGKMK